MIKAFELYKAYKKGRESLTALAGVSLEVKSGEILGISGRSGSGKTTLLYLLAGFLFPDQGKVCFKEKNLAELSPAELSSFHSRELGFVFQQFNLIPYLTVKENLTLPLIYGGFAPPQRAKRVPELLELFSLGEKARHYPPELSGGELQRAALARAIACSPKLVLADEPTAELDTENAGNFYRLVLNLQQKGLTWIIVSHDPLAEQFFSRKITLEQGKIIP